jgi:hypothetical protein
MKIVDRKTFLAMAEGIIFSRYLAQGFSYLAPGFPFGELCIKAETFSHGVVGDFYFRRIASSIKFDNWDEYFSIMADAYISGNSIPMDFDCQDRDGFFGDGQLFAIWEEPDIRAFTERLRQAFLASKKEL